MGVKQEVAVDVTKAKSKARRVLGHGQRSKGIGCKTMSNFVSPKVYCWLLGIVFGLMIGNPVQAQDERIDNDEQDQTGFKKLTETEINFLFNYYEQDGENAAVTGGRGTEELDNIAPGIIVNIPLDTNRNLIANFGFDKYSSASTDRIDNSISSASSSDTRFYLNATYSKKNSYKRETYSYKAGASVEYDYVSTSFGFGWAKESKGANTELGLSGMAYFDTWSVIHPAELRGTSGLNEDKGRQSFNFSATLSQVINKKLQASISTELVYQAGRLSTPFHRVFFTDILTDQNANPGTERLPDSRLKIPIGLRINYYLNDLIVLRGYYRYYTDDFGINANTLSLETPIKIGRAFSIAPFARYHDQTAADYFAAYGEHERTEEFYTSDYDLSAISSTTLGVGFKYSPLYGLGRFKGPFSKRKRGRITQFKSLEVRVADYTRTGNNPGGGGDLDAISVSFDLTFTF